MKGWNGRSVFRGATAWGSVLGCLALGVLLPGCADMASPDVPVEALDYHSVVFDESFLVGGRPISVLLVRPAQPGELEATYSRRLAETWVEGLIDHEAPWRIGVLPVGADEDLLPRGGLMTAESGSSFLSNGHPDPYALLDQLLEPVAAGEGGNAVFSTLNAMGTRVENEDFFIESGLFVIHVVSLFEDSSHLGAEDALADWLRQDHSDQWAATEFNVATNLVESACAGGESEQLLGVADAVGGFEQDICDTSGPERVVDTYTQSLTSHSMRLSHEPYRFSIDVRSPDYHGPPLERDVDFTYTQLDRTVTLLTWKPDAPTPVWVSYVPRL